MALYIHTQKCEKIILENAQGVVSEIMNRELCGAETGTALLRWLEEDESFRTADDFPGIQLLYIIEGQASVSLAGENYDLEKGAGVYLEKNDFVTIKNSQQKVLNILHIQVFSNPAANETF